ncbi:MAG: LamG-like jellyroll fold domain-containing protein, partial [Planctomycetota bacterium]
MLAKRCFLVGICTLLSLSLVTAAQPIHPTTGEPLMVDCLRGTPDAIDGDLSDWNLEAMTPAVLDTVEQLSSGQDIWTGPEDCSAEFYMLWDDVNIYMAVVVKDEKVAMNKTDASIWNSDCVEILFATTDAMADHSWSNPTIHYQYGFNANNQTWNWCNMDGPGQSVPDYLQAASSITADGYICEVSIEHGQMLSLDFSAGNTIGIHPCIDDTDIDNGDTEYQMSWTGLPAHDQSTGFGHMLLSADSVPGPEPVNPGSDGLVAHYAFEDNVDDSSGNGLAGTMVGDPVFVEGLADYGMALDFDGIDDVVELGKFDVIGQITLAAWIMADDFEINDARIMSTISETSLRFRLKTDDGQGTATLISDPVLEAGVWAHVAATWDGSTMRIYKDGAEVASQEKGGTAVAVDPSISVAIGSQPSDAFASDPVRVVKFFDGLIDEAQIYERALSDGELLYLAGERATPVDPGADGLVASYALDNDASDSSGNGHNGTVEGAPIFVAPGWDGTGACMQFGGDSDRITIEPFDLAGSGITLAAWVNVVAFQDDARIISKSEGSGTADHYWAMILSGGDENNLQFRLRTDVGSTTRHSAPDTEDLELDEWTHIAVTWDAGDPVMRFYKDGREIFSQDKAGGAVGTNPDIKIAIGNQSASVPGDGAIRPFGGMIDDVGIYQRALSVGEIRYLAGFRVNLLQNPSFEEAEPILDDPDWFQWCTWNPAEG